MMEQPNQKIVTWALGPETLEDLFKAQHGVSDSAEIVAITADPTTGFVLCMFEVSDLTFDSLKDVAINSDGVMNSGEIYN